MVVEVYLLRCLADGLLAYRSMSGPLRASENPDEAAARIARILPGPFVVLHSTSWRPLSDGSIVLAYAVAPDPGQTEAAIPITSFQMVHGPGPSRPCPPRVSDLEVAAHAACHLALIADINPQVRQVLAAHPALSQVLAALPRVPAGQFPGRTATAAVSDTGEVSRGRRR